MASTSGESNVSATMVKGVDLDIPGQFRSSNQMRVQPKTWHRSRTSCVGRKLDMVLGGDVISASLLRSIDFQRRLFRFGRSGMTAIRPYPSHSLEACEIRRRRDRADRRQAAQAPVDLGFNGDISLSPDAWAR